MPSTIVFEPFDIILVPFPFTDQSTIKKRPALIISSEQYHQQRPDLIIQAITSNIQRSDFGETPIRHWQAAGLLKPSVAKPVITTIETSIVLLKLGHLAENDQEAARQNLEKILMIEQPEP